MSTRRRAGTWQDEVARSFSRLFSRSSSQEKEEESAKDSGEEQDRGDRSLSRLFFRSSSQEKKDGSDRTEHGEEQERSHSPSRLFFRKITQEGKGGTDNVSPAKGTKEEPDRSRGFSRLFTRTSSQEKEEESDNSRGAREDQSRHEDDPSNQTFSGHLELSAPEPEQVTLEQTSNPPLHNISGPEEEENGEFTPNSKVIDSEKQSRENFFHFIGNLFHFSPKSSVGNLKQSAGVQEPCKEHEDAQVKNNLDKEDLDQERTLDDHSGTEEASEQNPAQHEQESPRVSEGQGDPKDLLKSCEDAATDIPKLNGHAQDAPAITYGTYRGSRRIRKLLKRRADVNSPIPEKEETPENCSVGEATTENCQMLHEWVKMEPAPDQNCQDETLPSNIHIEMQSKLETCDQNSISHNDDSIVQEVKNSEHRNDLETEAKDRPVCSNIIQADADNSSEIEERQQPSNEQYTLDVPQPNAQESFQVSRPNPGEGLEDLQSTSGESLNILRHLKENVENSEDHSKESTISKKLEPKNIKIYTDAEPKTVDISDTVWHIQPNIDEVLEQPNSKKSESFTETLETSNVNNSKSETDPSLKAAENVNILPNENDKVEDSPTQHVHENGNISISQKSETLFAMDNLQPEVKDTLVRTEKLEESSKENTEDPVDLGKGVAVGMQSSLQQSNLKKVWDSGDCSNNQPMVELDLHVEDKPHRDPSDTLDPIVHNRLDSSSDKNCKNFSLPCLEYLKPEIERMSNVGELQPNAQLESNSTVAVEPNIMSNLAKEEKSKLHGDLNQELNSTVLNKTNSESEDVPHLHVQLNENFRTSEDLKQIGNLEQVQTNANIIPKNDPQNDEELFKTDELPNNKGSLQFKEVNNTLLEKTLSESSYIPHFDLQLNEVSKTTYDLQNNDELLKTELQPSTKRSFQSKELNNTILEKTLSESKDIPNLDLQLSEMPRTSKDLIEIKSIELPKTDTNILPENNPQKEGEFLKTEVPPNSKVSSQLKELNITVLENTLSELDVPNLDLQLSEPSKTYRDLKEVGNVELSQTSANIFPENNPQKDGEFLKTEEPANAKVSLRLKELENILLDKSMSGNVEHLKTNANIISEKDLQKDEELEVNFQLKENSDESPLKSGIISKMIENQKPNLHIVSNVSDGIQTKVEQPAKVNLYPEPYSEIQVPEIGSDCLGTEVPPNSKVSLQLKEVNNAVLLKNLSESEDVSNLELQPNKTSRTSEDLNEIRNMEPLQTNANIITENDPQKDGELEVHFQLKENSDESLLTSGIISKMIENQKPNLHIVSKVSDGIQAEVKEPSDVNLCLESNSKIHVPEIINDSLDTEVPPDSKVSFQLKELNNTFSENTLSGSEGVPNLDLQLNDTSRTSKDLNEIGNIEPFQTNVNIITDHNPQKDGEFINTELPPNSKVSIQLKDLNNTVLQKTLSGSEDVPKIDQQPNETSRISKDLNEIGNIEPLQTTDNIIIENDLQKEVQFQLKENSDESPLTSGIIPKMIENQKPNIHFVSNLSDGIHSEVEEPANVNLCLEPYSKIHVPEISNDSLIHQVAQRRDSVGDRGLTETRHSNYFADEKNVSVDKPDGEVKELNIKCTVSCDNLDNMTVPESSLNDILLLSKGHEAVTSRNISFDNGIECRSPSSPTTSDSSSYADCNDVPFDSPNDSGIVSSQAYTPDEHILFKTLPSEILIKNSSDPFVVDQKIQEASVPEPDSIVNIQSVPILQNKEPIIDIHNVSEAEHDSLLDGCTSNSASDLSIKSLTPDKLINSDSDVYVAKVSVNTVNVEEVKISPYGLCCDIVSIAKLESPTFTKEVICIPNLSPTRTDTENTFQIFHCVQDDKNVNICEKPLKNFNLETDQLPLSKEDNNVTTGIFNDSPNNVNSDSISQYVYIEKKSSRITDKSPEVLIENVKNNNVNVCTGDNILNVSLKAHESERELADEALMANDSWKQLDESLSELNPDSKMNHREKLSDLLLHSVLLQQGTDTNEIISSCSSTAKTILPDEDHSEASNELFEQKANEIIFRVLHSAIDELQNFSQSHMNKSVNNNNTLTDIKHVKENLSENQIDLEKKHPAEVLVKCLGTPSEHILLEDTDLIMSMALGIVNDVISSSKQLVVSNIIPDVLSKHITTNEATQQKPPNDFNGLSMDNQSDPSEDATNSNHVVFPLSYDNVSCLPTYEINSNILHVTAEEPQNIKSIQAMEPKSLNELGSRVTEDMSENGMDRTIESETEDEDLSFSRNSVDYTNEDLDDLYCDRPMVSLSLGTEGSMEDTIYNYTCEERSKSSDFSDSLQFSVYKSCYVEISGSDDESTDEDKESGNEQASDNDSFLSVQSRRVRIYPFALSPIYEDDSAYEDTLSERGSPRYNEGASASNSGNDHTSILSLLQSVSDRLKEADLKETSPEESNDRFNKEGSGEPEDMISSSKTSLDELSTLQDEKASLGKRSGLFITKSETKPNPVLGRQSFLLNLMSQSNIYGAKSSVENSSVPSFRNESSVSPTAKSNLNQSPDLSPSIDSVNLLSPEPTLPIPSSAPDHNPRASTKSVYYQYFHAAQNYASKMEDSGSPVQKTLEEPKKTAELDMDSADSDSLKFNPRPGKVILSDIVDQENKIELKANLLDATSWVFSNGVNIRVIRGCWILYEKPHFEGQAHVLEEGEAVLRHLWDLPGANANLDKITIGSVKRVVKDYLPEVVISSLQDVSDSPIYIRTEVPSLENLVDKHPRSLLVNSGVWLAYTEPQYNGIVSVLEEGRELPQIQESGLKSMRPLKMGGLKVQLPSDPKIIVYEKPHFQGWSREITDHVSSIGPLTCDEENSSSQDVGSMQVIGGIWVGYENERYKGHQYLLEEGDYEDCHAWGGYNNSLKSVRYLQADFLEPSVTLYETDEEDGKQINLFNQAIPDLELAGYNTRTQCIHVKKGMWVAYQQKHFCGEQYVLEKGRYKTYMDWGGSSNTIKSIRPVLLEPLGRNDAKHLIQAYTSAEFQGETMDFTQGIYDFTSFLPMSFKVLRGCWLLCYKADTCDNLCVLEEGHFPDLASCGCPTAEIKYIKPIDYFFAEPSLSLFALDSCEGRELHFEAAVTSVLSADLHFYAQSVWVKRGLWIAFEGANFLGRQMLLDPQQILNWSQFSGWKAIGSLRPLKQTSVYFMVKNRVSDKYLTASGKVADSRATFVSVSPRNGQTTQIWYFCRGFLKSKANDLCLDVIGGKNIPGSKVSLWAEHGKIRQKWTINKEGTISSHISDDLVLDLRGGNYYDQNYIVVNRVQERDLTQKWDIEIL